MSQCQQILSHLKSGKTLTPLQAFRLFACLTLSQRVTELKQRGHAIKSRIVKVGSKRVARYSI